MRNHLVVWHEYVVENSERKKINAVEKDPKERVAEIMKLAKAKAQLEAEKVTDQHWSRIVNNTYFSVNKNWPYERSKQHKAEH